MKNDVSRSTLNFSPANQPMSKTLLPKQPIRVLIADDHPRSRDGLRALLTTSPLIKIVGEAADGQEAVRLVETCWPDVVLMDAQMPLMDGLEASRRIKRQWPRIRIIMLTVYNGRRNEAVTAGIDVFLAKGCPIETLWSAVLPPPETSPHSK